MTDRPSKQLSTPSCLVPHRQPGSLWARDPLPGWTAMPRPRRRPQRDGRSAACRWSGSQWSLCALEAAISLTGSRLYSRRVVDLGGAPVLLAFERQMTPKHSSAE